MKIVCTKYDLIFNLFIKTSSNSQKSKRKVQLEKYKLCALNSESVLENATEAKM